MCVIDYTRNTLQNHNTIIHKHILCNKKKSKQLPVPMNICTLSQDIKLILSIELKICNHP